MFSHSTGCLSILLMISFAVQHTGHLENNGNSCTFFHSSRQQSSQSEKACAVLWVGMDAASGESGKARVPVESQRRRKNSQGTACAVIFCQRTGRQAGAQGPGAGKERRCWNSRGVPASSESGHGGLIIIKKEGLPPLIKPALCTVQPSGRRTASPPTLGGM